MSFSWPAAEQTELEEPETVEETGAQNSGIGGGFRLYTGTLELLYHGRKRCIFLLRSEILGSGGDKKGEIR